MHTIKNYFITLIKRQSISLISLLFIFFMASSQANPNPVYPGLPKEGNFIIDIARVITQEDTTKINAIANALWQEKQIPLVVVTLDSLNAMKSTQGIEQYTSNLFNKWQLGLKDKNYGIILLVSIKDRKSRIEFGAAWEHRYDREANDITQNYLIPEFKAGNYSAGLRAGTESLNNLARGLALPEVKTPWWYWPLLVGVAVFLIFSIYSLFKSGRSGWAWALIVFIGIALWWILRNAGSGSTSGGGSSGGGGATGSW